jgi:hypothetical protein
MRFRLFQLLESHPYEPDPFTADPDRQQQEHQQQKQVQQQEHQQYQEQQQPQKQKQQLLTKEQQNRQRLRDVAPFSRIQVSNRSTLPGSDLSSNSLTVQADPSPPDLDWMPLGKTSISSRDGAVNSSSQDRPDVSEQPFDIVQSIMVGPVQMDESDEDFASTPNAFSEETTMLTGPGQVDDSTAGMTAAQSALSPGEEQVLSSPAAEPPPPVRRVSQEAAFYVDRTPGQLIASLLLGVLLSGGQ